MEVSEKESCNEEKEEITPISEGIAGTWKPSSLVDYSHFVKPGEPIKRSRWLTGQLSYSLTMGYLSWELTPTEPLKNTGKETNVRLRKQMEYSDHSETWSFENDDLVIVFKNKTDQSVIKKYYKFILGGKLHIVYHNLVDNVTSTRIYERVF